MRLKPNQLTGELLRRLWALNNSCFDKDEHPSFGIFEYHATNGAVYATPNEASPVGIAIVTPHTHEPHLWTLAVAKENRRAGYGEDLLCEVLGDFHEITLHTRVDNGPAQMLYLKYGFRVEKIAKNYYPNRVDGLFMRRKP